MRATPLKTRLTSLTLLILMFTIAGMTIAPPPPSAPAMAGSSLVALVRRARLPAGLERLRMRRNANCRTA